MENPKFTEYYKAQNLMTDEEWDLNMKYLQTSLPTNFRITACNQSTAKSLKSVRIFFIFNDYYDTDYFK